MPKKEVLRVVMYADERSARWFWFLLRWRVAVYLGGGFKYFGEPFGFVEVLSAEFLFGKNFVGFPPLRLKILVCEYFGVRILKIFWISWGYFFCEVNLLCSRVFEKLEKIVGIFLKKNLIIGNYVVDLYGFWKFSGIPKIIDKHSRDPFISCIFPI